METEGGKVGFPYVMFRTPRLRRQPRRGLGAQGPVLCPAPALAARGLCDAAFRARTPLTVRLSGLPAETAA